MTMAKTWIKASAQTQWDAFFSSSDDYTKESSFQISFDNTGEILQFNGRVESMGSYIVNIGTVTGEWQHVAVTFDGTSVKTYLDGVPQNTGSTTFEALFEVYKLGVNRSNGRFFAGEIDEFRIWSTARTEDEIQTYMNTTVLDTESYLKAYYRFDQTDGTELIDLTDNDHDGTINGSPSWVTSGADIE